MSTKRKRDMPKFYAVRAGHHTGVFGTWEECKAQTTGFSGAQFKSFENYEDAAAFVAGKNPPKKDEPIRYYAVAIGNRPGIYNDWPSAQRAISNVKGPKYKRFDSYEECLQFIREKGNLAAFKALGLVKEEDDVADDGDGEGAMQPAEKKVKTESSGVAGGSKQKGSENFIDIYTDGASKGNGKSTAVAGVGVFFGHGDPRNISEPLAGTPQTNQRVELTAIQRALESVPMDHSVRIYSDSNYSIKCVTEWFISWRKTNWTTRTGPVKNRDLVEAIIELIELRQEQGGTTKFVWVKGHDGLEGNVAADRLAVQGCRR